VLPVAVGENICGWVKHSVSFLFHEILCDITRHLEEENDTLSGTHEI